MNTREQFGNYLLLKKLTEDPLGETFRAGMVGDGGMERVTLLRVFNGQGVDGQRLWTAVESRAPIATKLRNPNVGEGVEVGEIQGLPYASYEYISGKNLAALLEQAARKRNYIAADHALLISERLALALAAAAETRHEGERVLHGFVCPHLVMISNEGETRLLGFEVGPGLRSFAANPVIRQHFGRYLAPEALQGQPLHPADDVYSLGVMLFELLTGRPLPPPAPEGFEPVIAQGVMANDGAPIPGELAEILRRSLVPREGRIGDAGTWHKALNKLMFEGQYNPTTFNLAFFMHNLFRDDIERESKEIEVEKTLPLPTVQRQTAPAGAATVPIAVDSDTGVVAPVTAASAAAAPLDESGIHAESSAAVARPPERKAWIVPAAVAAAVLLLAAVGLWWWLGQRDAAAQAAVEQAPPVVAPPPPAGPTEEEINSKIRELIEQQTTAMEDEFRQEYEQQLADLQGQLERARREADTRRQREREAEEAARLQAEAEAAAAAEAEAQQAALEAEDVPGAEGGEGDVSEPPAAEDLPEPVAVAEAEPPPAVEQAPPPPPPPPVAPQVRRGDLVELGPGVAPPRLVRRPTARFPERALRLNRREAKVIVRVLIDENGKVIKTELSGERQGYGFDTEAVNVAKRSVYKPATKDGVPVKVWYTLAVEFRSPR